MKNYFYVTFLHDGWQDKWLIICDSWGLPITDIKEAKKQLTKDYPNKSWGIADREQMLLGNAMQDNF